MNFISKEGKFPKTPPHPRNCPFFWDICPRNVKPYILLETAFFWPRMFGTKIFVDIDSQSKLIVFTNNLFYLVDIKWTMFLMREICCNISDNSEFSSFEILLSIEVALYLNWVNYKTNNVFQISVCALMLGE